MALAGTLTVILLLTCCYFFCCNVCCNRGKKRTYLTDDGYLLEYDKRWSSVPNVPESEVQEVSINMKEETLGVIEFEVETEESNCSDQRTSDCARSETPIYSEVATTNLLATGYQSTEGRRRSARAKSEPVVIFNDAEEPTSHRNERTGSVNGGFSRSQEWPIMVPGQPPHIRARLQEITRSKSTGELGSVYRDTIENHLLLYFNKATNPDDNMGMQQTNRKSPVTSSSGGSDSGRRHESSGSSRGVGLSHQIEFLERDIVFMDDEETRRYNQQSKVKLYANGEGSPSHFIGEGVQRSKRGKEIIYTEVTNDQLKEDGYEIFNFDDGTVYAEVQFDRQF